MKAAYIQRTGAPNEIVYGELPEPVPGVGQVLVKVAATSVNPIDTYIRSGAVATALPMPFIVGADFAGTVAAIGEGCRHFRPGDRVWGSNQGMMGRQGAAAEFIAVDEGWVYPLDGALPFADAAALALVGITAHLGLFDRARLRSNETVLATGGSGGVGSTVIQMAKAAGAKVIATAGSEAKALICRELGADQVVQYKTENVAARIKELAPNGVDVWFEVHREPDLDVAINALAKGGRFVAMAGRAARPILPLGSLYTKDCSIVGFAMFNAAQETQRIAASQIVDWMKSGKIRPVIDRTLPLDQMAQAHRLQEQNIAGGGILKGKIVLM